jgi:hypothetical protein
MMTLHFVLLVPEIVDVCFNIFPLKSNLKQFRHIHRSTRFSSVRAYTTPGITCIDHMPCTCVEEFIAQPWRLYYTSSVVSEPLEFAEHLDVMLPSEEQIENLIIVSYNSKYDQYE